MLCPSRHLAMYKESESILKEVLAICEKQHGGDSVEVASALNTLGNTYYMMGQLKEGRFVVTCYRVIPCILADLVREVLLSDSDVVLHFVWVYMNP